MFPLNLPPYSFKTKNTTDGKTLIFDRLRNKYVALTPEEYVRQNFVEFLIQEKKYPASLIANEISITYNGLKKRCDTLVYKRNGTIGMIIEYKAPHIDISQNTFDQLAVYNLKLNVNKFIVTNGLTHYCGEIDAQKASYRFFEEIPDYDNL